MLAKKAATVDEISGGRLILGLGAGWNETEYLAFGFPFDHRISRFEEAFTIIRTLLREGAIDFEGEYYTVRDCELRPRGRRPGGPPILLGSNGERMLAIGAPHIDSWNSWFADTGNSPAGVGTAARQRGCRRPGRRSRSRRHPADRRGAGPPQRGSGSGPGRVRQAPESAARGRPEIMAEELRAYAREGIGHVQLVLDPISLASIEEFAPVLEALDRG